MSGLNVPLTYDSRSLSVTKSFRATPADREKLAVIRSYIEDETRRTPSTSDCIRVALAHAVSAIRGQGEGVDG